MNEKCDILENKIQETEEMINIIGSITPVEVEENSNARQITEVLEECARKLEKSVKSIPLSDLQARTNSLGFYSARKNTKQQSFIEKFAYRSEKKSSRKASAVKSRFQFSSDKENHASKCTRKLFAGDNSPREMKPSNRESLGLLPESCLQDDLTCLSTSISALQEIDTNASTFKSVGRIDEDYFAVPHSRQVLGKISQNKFVREKLAEILHGHNRQIIWNLFQNLDENVHALLVKNLDFDQRKHFG